MHSYARMCALQPCASPLAASACSILDPCSSAAQFQFERKAGLLSCFLSATDPRRHSLPLYSPCSSQSRRRCSWAHRCCSCVNGIVVPNVLDDRGMAVQPRTSSSPRATPSVGHLDLQFHFISDASLGDDCALWPCRAATRARITRAIH